MEDLIKEYRESRQLLRRNIRIREKEMLKTDDFDLKSRLQQDVSIMNGMEREMTENIGLMESPLYGVRESGPSQSSEVVLDPAILSRHGFPKNKNVEAGIRSAVFKKYWMVIHTRIDTLTEKQKDTLRRWIYQSRTLSEIAEEDGVSRQAVWVRIFGDKTNKGAIPRLRDGA